jgi:curved DNA-binding protein CbpA
VPAVDLYEVLQVAPRADPEVVLAAYRTLARKHHPDAGGDGRVMATLNAAWQILGRPELRHAYDLERARAIARTRAPGALPVAGDDGDPAQARRPPPGTGTVLDFGRYAGWSIGSLAKSDPDYLEWLTRTSIGRSFKREVDAALAAQARAAEMLRPPVDARSARGAPHGWFAR